MPVAQARTGGGREQFSADELACVLSHYDIGFIESIADYPRGSRKSPKLLLQSDQGKFLLKRRAKGKDDAFKVAFCHGLQLHLAAQQYPLPHLIGTRRDNNSMLQWHGSVYELFEYIPGQSYPHTLEATFDSARVLGLFHKLLSGYESRWQPATGSYHAAAGVDICFRQIPKVLGGGTASEGIAALGELLDHLQQAYHNCSATVESLGLSGWPQQIVHADWHPGNMLFRENHVVAVIDYDSARVQPRVLDMANGAVQFSIQGGGDDLSQWPTEVDLDRYSQFVRGYDGVCLLSEAEINAIPYLMAEALIAEAVYPIAATGTFGRLEGMAFLKMVARKVDWILDHAPQLIRLGANTSS